MSTIAYLFVFIALLIFRQVYKGRVMNIGQDLSDLFIAFTTGDTAKFTEVLARTGAGNAATTSTATAAELVPVDRTAPPGTKGIAAAALQRGKAAKGYRLTGTGPDYYDCSGLMWRAAQDCGFTGIRFTTSTIQLSKQMKEISPPATQGPGVSAAGINDIVVWPGHHMGVIVSPGRFYSARNPKSGIGEAAIEGFRTGTRKYYRVIP